MTHSALPVRSVTIDAPPGRVLAFLAQPASLPKWAPRFADHAEERRADAWTTTSEGRSREVLVRHDPATGTLDLLAPSAPDLGVFSRVVPHGSGSVLALMVNLGPAASDADVAAQMRVVEEELDAVRRFCEAREPTGAA